MYSYVYSNFFLLNGVLLDLVKEWNVLEPPLLCAYEFSAKSMRYIISK